jgi:hypothetical protein
MAWRWTGSMRRFGVVGAFRIHCRGARTRVGRMGMRLPPSCGEKKGRAQDCQKAMCVERITHCWTICRPVL